MDRSFDVESVIHGQATTSTLLRRGLRKKCPRCGSGHLFVGWFRMKERCPTCGYQFEREPGFFVGVFLINFAITEGFLFVLLMVFILWKNAHPEAPVAAPIGIGLVIGVVAPILFYPFARTIWSAIDLAMTPLEVPEIVAAVDALDASDGEGEAEVGETRPGPG